MIHKTEECEIGLVSFQYPLHHCVALYVLLLKSIPLKNQYVIGDKFEKENKGIETPHLQNRTE